MFTCGRDRSIKIWNPRTGELIRELDHNSGPIGSMAITSDGGSAFGTPSGKGFQTWNARTGRQGGVVEVPDSAWTLAIAPDDATIAIGTWAGTVDLWDLRSNSRFRTLKVFDQLIGSVAFSPDGSIIAAGSVGGTIKLVDVGTGKVLVTLDGHGAIIYCLEFSRDGSRLISASDDGSAAIWDLTYYDRHIVGNLEYQLLISPSAGQTPAASDALRNWGAQAQSRTWPRRGLSRE